MADGPTNTERSLAGRLGAHIRWAAETDPAAATAPARAAFLDRFEREVDPDGTLAPDERTRRAAHARKAYFTRLAMRSAQARRARKPGRDDALVDEVDRAARGTGRDETPASPTHSSCSGSTSNDDHYLPGSAAPA